MSLEKSYWNHNGKFQALADALNKLVPCEGNIKGKNNVALERFRKASNCYYDLYNNGLGNRASSFSKLFGIAAGNYRLWNNRFSYSPALYEIVEVEMDKVILAAAAEQLNNLPSAKD
jgi:hypothetical protein